MFILFINTRPAYDTVQYTIYLILDAVIHRKQWELWTTSNIQRGELNTNIMFTADLTSSRVWFVVSFINTLIVCTLTVITRFPLLSFLNLGSAISGSFSFFHVMVGFGAPNTWHVRTAVWPSETFVTDLGVSMKLGGSAATKKKPTSWTLTFGLDSTDNS